jgi:hypothetical protein
MDVIVLGFAFGLFAPPSATPTPATGFEENGHDL